MWSRVDITKSEVSKVYNSLPFCWFFPFFSIFECANLLIHIKVVVSLTQHCCQQDHAHFAGCSTVLLHFNGAECTCIQHNIGSSKVQKICFEVLLLRFLSASCGLWIVCSLTVTILIFVRIYDWIAEKLISCTFCMPFTRIKYSRKVNFLIYCMVKLKPEFSSSTCLTPSPYCCCGLLQIEDC